MLIIKLVHSLSLLGLHVHNLVKVEIPFVLYFQHLFLQVADDVVLGSGLFQLQGVLFLKVCRLRGQLCHFFNLAFHFFDKKHILLLLQQLGVFVSQLVRQVYHLP